jgi:SsrA-binding protein
MPISYIITLDMTGMLIAKNRKALYDHELLEKYSAGVVLKGAEVKAIREKQVNFEGSYIQILQGVPYLINMNIGRYSKQGKTFVEQDARRSRLLLLNQNEIDELKRLLHEKGHTAIPMALVLKNNSIKLEFGVMKGKKEFQKKLVVKERQIERDLLAANKDTRRMYWK